MALIFKVLILSRATSFLCILYITYTSFLLFKKWQNIHSIIWIVSVYFSSTIGTSAISEQIGSNTIPCLNLVAISFIIYPHKIGMGKRHKYGIQKTHLETISCGYHFLKNTVLCAIFLHTSGSPRLYSKRGRERPDFPSHIQVKFSLFLRTLLQWNSWHIALPSRFWTFILL